MAADVACLQCPPACAHTYHTPTCTRWPARACPAACRHVPPPASLPIPPRAPSPDQSVGHTRSPGLLRGHLQVGRSHRLKPRTCSGPCTHAYMHEPCMRASLRGTPHAVAPTACGRACSCTPRPRRTGVRRRPACSDARHAAPLVPLPQDACGRGQCRDAGRWRQGHRGADAQAVCGRAPARAAHLHGARPHPFRRWLACAGRPPASTLHPAHPTRAATQACAAHRAPSACVCAYHH